MKKLLLILTLAVVATSCYKPAQKTSTEGNGFNVEFLFEKDNVKVYRFFDGGRYHYFTSKGETITTQPEGEDEYQENIK